MTFTQQQQQELLGFVRATLSAYLSGETAPAMPDFPQLKELGGSFVSLYESGEVRGCIGTAKAVEPLGENLRRNAVNAGCADPNFPPLTAAEMAEISIEISVVTPPKKLLSPDEILLGRDGIMLRSGSRSALFLPQIAVEQQWDVPETLLWLCKKAGLPENAINAPETELFTFETELFGEPRIPNEDDVF